MCTDEDARDSMHMDNLNNTPEPVAAAADYVVVDRESSNASEVSG